MRERWNMRLLSKLSAINTGLSIPRRWRVRFQPHRPELQYVKGLRLHQ
jgi:hypothetical protein